MSDKNRYAGMTVNERLFAARLLENFDAAVRANDHAEMVRILEQVQVNDAAWTADTILQRADKYGF